MIRVAIEEHRYRVVGSTAADIRGAMALLAPRLSGCAFGGATTWRVQWSFAPRAGRAGFSAEDIVLALVASVRLPEWRPVWTASSELTAAFDRYVVALRAHERDHVAIGLRAARAVRAELSRLPAAGSARALEQRASDAAGAVIDAWRARERAFDAATDHGRANGAVFPA